MRLVIEGRRNEGAEKLDEEPVFVVQQLDCIINRSIVHSSGSLYLTSEYGIFLSSPEEDYSLVIDYKAIGVHAVCHSADIYKRPCVYCQLSDPEEDEFDCATYSPGFDIESEEDNDACECIHPNSGVYEVLFSPDDDTILNPLFDSLSHLQTDCQSPEEDLFDIDRDIAFDCNMAQLFEQADIEYQTKHLE
ncbi:hypothetical protein WA171_002719 [Blastocystis sp. BT1]